MLGDLVAMADDRHTGIADGSWWSSSRPGIGSVSSPCFGWTDIARSGEEPSSISDCSMVFRDAGEKQQASGSAGSSGGGGSVLIDPAMQKTSFGLSPPPAMDWSQALLRSGGRAESSFHDMIQEDSSAMQNFRQEAVMESINVQKDWSPKNFVGGREEAPANVFKQINQALSLDQPCLHSREDCAMVCQGLPANSFSISSTPFDSPPAPVLLQGLFDSNSQAQPAIFENQSFNYVNSNDVSSSWPRFSQFLNPPFTPKPQPPSQLQFSNNTPFWNASSASMAAARSNFFPFPQNQLLAHSFDEKPNCSSLSVKRNMEELVDSSSSLVKKISSDPASKRPKMETSSPQPAFKVRKEKLGDRITALQQLVSPFGKTDTASVLFEAIECIKFLHEQVTALSSSYMKNGAAIQHQQNQGKGKDGEGLKQDLRSRGLCLVPISSTYGIASEGAPDLWAPTYGGSFR